MVVAAIRAGLRAGVDNFGVQRMHRESADRRRLGQAVMQCLPFAATVGHAIEAGLHHPAAPGFTGVDLTQFQLPTGLPSGTSVPVLVSINGMESNTVMLPVK